VRSFTLLLLLLPACGTSDEIESGAAKRAELATADPVGVATAFFGAARTGDVSGFQSMLTAAAREGMASGGGGFELGENVGSFEIGEAEVDGDTAEVPVHAVIEDDPQDLRLCMRHEEGTWRVFGFRLAMDGESTILIDLESMGGLFSEMETAMQVAFQESFEHMRQGGSPEEIRAKRARFDSLAAISEEEHDLAWRIDVHVQDRPATEVLVQALVGTGLSFDMLQHAEALSLPVNLELTGVSRLEAIERTCRQIGLFPVYPDADETPFAFAGGLVEGLATVVDEALPGSAQARAELPASNAITFERGMRTVAFAGPFLIEVLDLEEHAPNATGRLTLGVRALGLAPRVLAFQTEMVESLVVEDILDPAEVSLQADQGMRYMGTPETSAALWQSQTGFDLKNLLRSASEVEVRGSVRLQIPLALRAASLSADDAELETVQGVTIERKEWGESTRFSVRGSEDLLQDLQVRFGATKASGEPLGILFSDWSIWGEQMNTGLQTPEIPGTVDLKLCTARELVYPFVLGGVPLRHWQEQPKVLATLGFDGSIPLQVEFVRFTQADEHFPKVELRLRNHSNKDAVHASATFVYVDASGTELESFPHTLTGEFNFAGQAPLAVQGGTATLETVAHFMPPGTARIEIRVESVTFVDASQWHAKE
jgi:hypothetical protein